MIYFIECREARAVKIGYADEPDKRIKQLQVGCPFRLRMQVVLPGDLDREKELHLRFDGLRRRGEWFDVAGELKEFLSIFEPRKYRLHAPPFPATQNAYCVHADNVASQCWAETRIPISVYWGSEPWMTGVTDRRCSYQVMPLNDWIVWNNPRLHSFWGWYVDGMPQWYATADEAADRFAASLKYWLKHIDEQGSPVLITKLLKEEPATS